MLNKATENTRESRKNIKPYRAIIETVGEHVVFSLDFQEFISGFEDDLGNVQDYKNNRSGLPKPSQKVFPNWKNELYNIWNEFSKEEAEKIIREFHARKKIGENQEGRGIYMNYNSYDFFRDTNISISIVDEISGEEICILGFFIQPNKTIELFQIQGKSSKGFKIEDYDELFKYLETLLQSLGFKRIVTLKSSKNYFSSRPFFTKGDPGSQEEKLWLEKHRNRMGMTYDGRPLRKWGFQKPEKNSDGEWYSGEKYI